MSRTMSCRKVFDRHIPKRYKIFFLVPAFSYFSLLHMLSEDLMGLEVSQYWRELFLNVSWDVHFQFSPTLLMKAAVWTFLQMQRKHNVLTPDKNMFTIFCIRSSINTQKHIKTSQIAIHIYPYLQIMKTCIQTSGTLAGKIKRSHIKEKKKITGWKCALVSFCLLRKARLQTIRTYSFIS